MTVPRRIPNCLSLVALPSAVRLAREHVSRSLKDFGLPGLLDTAGILTSELVSNAVKAVGTLDTAMNWREVWPPPQTIAVCCYSTNGHAVVEVWDNDPHPPVRKQAADTDEGGRGLLVEALSDRWGYRWPKTGGKVVWCALKETGDAYEDHWKA